MGSSHLLFVIRSHSYDFVFCCRPDNSPFLAYHTTEISPRRQIECSSRHSSALMLRGTMPREVGNGINDALGAGALDAGWVQRWFDMFFIGAVILTSQGLWVGRKFGGNDSWDDETWDSDVEMGGKRL